MAHFVELIGKLNKLLKRCYDSEKGYQQAAKNVSNGSLKETFTVISDKRYQYGHEIKAEIKRLGGEPIKGTSLEGDLHRTWISIKSTFTGGDEEAILKECEKGEESMVEDYQEVLNTVDLPEETEKLIKMQAEGVKSDLNKMRNLEQIHS